MLEPVQGGYRDHSMHTYYDSLLDYGYIEIIIDSEPFTINMSHQLVLD